MAYYPIFIKLDGKTALVVGGGRVAQRKIETLLEYGASIHIISKELTDRLKQLVEAGDIRHMGENFENKHLDGAFLVIAATDDEKLNHEISETAQKRGLLINAVDQPADCNFIVPSIVKRGDLVIAISTSGKSPALAKKLGKKMGEHFGSEYEAFLTLMGFLRKEVLKMGLSQDENRRIFKEIVDSNILEDLIHNDRDGVKSTLRQIVPGDVVIPNDLLMV
ncbi:MAG: bifunctional precorrin-2 dehydrogenase/sirohydrochlorin ferrochelatase [Deltaproteobacteria bacterium]|nr:bifunctional precorrin-2 dehydrogenase/sirohydrochlorin ferrochelatase [Deltaproteobacteria bacterium]MBW2117177.1 bifunctional precorrin-2 dehydrogenase/sirohydrochlorin ferrochelatase [Deltaproteobacteria bacterium]MBW2343662.1 bifunctional precorrin-2 dehydrogenase/sirohydrochlorin ferrochelatase [Deltaproteobacteria bacterium]